MNILIIAADQNGPFSEKNKVLKLAKEKNLRVAELEITPLSRPWDDPLTPHEFKSGASAMAAIEKAKELLKLGDSDLVVIKGSDALKTGYDKEKRKQLMQLYENDLTPLEGYDRLVPLFLDHHGFSEEDYFSARDSLFESYTRVWKEKHPKASLPDERWYRPLTNYFRGVDCANPSIDYEGQIVLASDEVANALNIPKDERVQILGNACEKLDVDGMESLAEIAPYKHLRVAINKALSEAGIDFKKEFLDNNALLDAYTCYPVVPMGLLLQLDLIEDLNDVPELLKDHDVTVTGGLNLAKAPWNLTSLNSLIEMRAKLLSSDKYQYGLSHGNGSLGNQQGITILGRT